MENNQQWLLWATELQSLAQAGLTFGRDVYDIERFQRIREISAEIMAHMTEIPLEKVKDLFCNEKGYQTPKLDCRAAVVEDGKILLVQEKDGRWTLPGGWCDVNLSVAENAVKEAFEEAGIEARADYIIAVQDRKKHNLPVSAYSIIKIFVACTRLGGEFKENSETLAAGFFSPDELPRLSGDKTTEAQIKMCLDAAGAECWQTLFD